MSESPLPPGAEAPPGDPERPPRKPVRGWLWLLLVVALGLGAYALYDRQQEKGESPA